MLEKVGFIILKIIYFKLVQNLDFSNTKYRELIEGLKKTTTPPVFQKHFWYRFFYNKKILINF
jgi:hypothetical protein